MFFLKLRWQQMDIKDPGRLLPAAHPQYWRSLPPQGAYTAANIAFPSFPKISIERDRNVFKFTIHVTSSCISKNESLQFETIIFF